MFSYEYKGGSGSTEAWLAKLLKGEIFAQLSRFGDEGVAALAAATPKDDGVTANSWYYEIKQDEKSWSIIWGNSNVENGVNIAVILQHGHATRTGGYVQGRDYINPAMRPIFDRMADEAWKAVRS